MRRSSILLATSMCLAVLVSPAVPSAFGQGSRSSPIPAGFLAQSITWSSPDHGWMLGSDTCGQGTCTTVIGTSDGGGTWNVLSALKAPLGFEQATGVSEIRFADDIHGWAFEPALWATNNGGATWRRQVPPGGSGQVLALAGDADAVYALVSPCRFGQFCKQPVTLWQGMPGQVSWTPVSLDLPRFNGFDLAILAVHGVVAYLGLPACVICPHDADVLAATVDGQTWSARPDPCVPSNLESLSGVAPVSDTEVALLCVGDPGFGRSDKRVLRSFDAGQTTESAGSTPGSGIVSQLAAAPDGTLVVSSFAIESYLYRNDGGQTWTTPVAYNDAGQGWNDVVFVTDQVGYVVHGPVSCCGGHGPGDLWKTDDGGLTWAPVA